MKPEDLLNDDDTPESLLDSEGEDTPEEEEEAPVPSAKSEPLFSLGGEDDDDDTFEPSGETKPKLSYPLQILELMGAGRNLVNKKIDEYVAGQQGNQPVSNEGKHDAASFRANVVGGGIGSGYTADPERNWRDDANDFITAPFEMDADKIKRAGGNLAKRLGDTVMDFTYETATDPLTYIGARGASKALSTADKIRRAGITGVGLGTANMAGREKDDDKPYIGPLEGAAVGATVPLAMAGGKKLLDVGDNLVARQLDGKTIDYAGKALELKQYPKLKESVEKKLKETSYLAHELRQGRLQALSELSDDSAVKVNQFVTKAKEAQNRLTPDEYVAEARAFAGHKNVDKYLQKFSTDAEAAVKAERANFLKEAGVKSPEDLPDELMADFSDIKVDDYKVKTDAVDALLTKADATGQTKSYLWNKSRKNAEDKFMAGDYNEAVKSLNEPELKAATEWAKVNEKYMSRYNQAKKLEEAFDPRIQPILAKEAPSGYVPLKEGSNVFVPLEKLKAFQKSPVVGFKFHNADIYDKQAFEESKRFLNGEVSSGLKRGTKAGESDAVERMIAEGVPAREAYDRAYATYTNSASRAFLTSSEKEAQAIVSAAQSEIKRGGLGVTDVADALSSAWKKKVLYLNTSWAKTNYYDNLMKTFMERGLGDTVKVGRLSKVSHKLTKDIEQILAGNPSHVASEKANEYVKYGVVDSDIFRDVANMSDVEKGLNYAPTSKAIQPGNSIADSIRAATDKAFNAPGVKQMANANQYLGKRFEWNARAVTYESIVGELEKKALRAGEITPEIADKIRKEAASATGDIFYDYGKVRAVEQEVGKRFIPFYSFLSKNFGYYGEKFTDPTKLGKVNQVQNILNKTGSSGERDPEYGAALQSENNWMTKGNSRRLGGSQDDYVTYASTPKLSMFDALNAMTNPTEALKQGLTPAKGIFDVIGGKDTFSGQSLDPAKNPFGGKNWLGQKGYKGLLLGDMLGEKFTTTPSYSLSDVASGDVKGTRVAKDILNLGLGTTGVKPNLKTGSPETDSAATMYNHAITSMLPLVGPMGGVGTAFNLYNSPAADMLSQMLYQSKGEDSKVKPVDWLMKLLGPVEFIKKDTDRLQKATDKQKGEGREKSQRYQKDQRDRERARDQ